MAEMIKFLRGNVASLPAQATAGAVYFTKDEGLYLGLADGTYHRYGDFIIVADVASLPAAGAHEACMYYCTSENILAKWDGSAWVQINKQKTLAELGGVAKSVYDAKMALLEKADTDNATAISNLTTYVGTIPETATATNIVAYIQEKTSGIATDTALEELTGRVADTENDIDDILASLAEGGDSYKAIADAQAAADAAQADVDALAEKVGTVAEGKTVVGLIDDAQKQADKGVADAATAQARADEAYNLANGKATMDEVNAAIAGAGHAVKSEVDKSISDMDAAYKKADSDMKTELEGKINAKVAQTDYDTKMTALDDEDERLAGLISGIDTEYKKADTALDGRIAKLEGDITGLSGAMHFKGVVEALPATTEGYANGDTIICGNKEYVVNGEAFVELGDVSAEVQRITDLEGVVGKAAEGENAATGLVKAAADNAAAIAAEQARAEAKEAELVKADTDNLAEAKKYTDDEIAALKIGDYAKQADLDTHTTNTDIHITAAERTAWNAAEQNAKDHATGLNTAMDARVAALELIDHDHANKEELDKIVAGDVAKWNAAQANAEAKAAELDAALKTALQKEIDDDVKALADGAVATNAANIAKNAEDIAKKANSADVYAKTETYTKTEINNMLTSGSGVEIAWGEF